MEKGRVLSTANIDFNGNYYVQMVSEKMLCNIPHSHDFYELVCVLFASCVQNINGIRKKCTAPSVTVLHPFEEHFFEEQEEGVAVLFLSVKKEEMQNFIRAYGLQDLNGSEEYILSTIDVSRLRTLYVQAVVHPDNSLILKNLLAVIVTGILECTVNRSFPMPDFAVQITEKMNKIENLREGLPALLRISGYSYCQLWRLMKQWFHMTPKEYINHLRMECAYTLILTGNQRVEDIANSVGFSSFSHFNDLIKKHYGVTSSELRNNLNKLSH